MKSRVAIVGAGISGLSLGRMLNDHFQVTLIEKSEKPGGLVKCDRVEDNLFHKVGGHVFNSRNQTVLDWFWGHFDRDTEFIKARRNAKIWIQDKQVGYPIENYLHQLPAATVSAVLDDMLALAQAGPAKSPEEYPNFEDFLRGNFGPTLFDLYFGPYNTKIWHTDLKQVPLGWLEGKLPMPNLKQMLLSNIVQVEESEMVHAAFYYAKENGSQFIADRLAEGLTVWTNTELHELVHEGEEWTVNGEATFDFVIYCGDVRHLGHMVQGVDAHLASALEAVHHLPSNGTSNLFCECDPTDVSWLYLPEADIKAHRIIYTGTFAESNNRGSQRQTCVVEFSGTYSWEEMSEEVKKLPGNLKPISWNQEPNSYVIQQPDTRQKISHIKSLSEPKGLYLLGRFAEWEYYNMDKAIEAAMELSQRLLAAR